MILSLRQRSGYYESSQTMNSKIIHLDIPSQLERASRGCCVTEFHRVTGSPSNREPAPLLSLGARRILAGQLAYLLVPMSVSHKNLGYRPKTKSKHTGGGKCRYQNIGSACRERLAPIPETKLTGMTPPGDGQNPRNPRITYRDTAVIRGARWQGHSRLGEYFLIFLGGEN